MNNKRTAGSINFDVACNAPYGLKPFYEAEPVKFGIDFYTDDCIVIKSNSSGWSTSAERIDYPLPTTHSNLAEVLKREREKTNYQP